MSEHKPRVFLTRIESGKPYKWWGECGCGWECMSWQWLREDGTGAYAMALQHASEARP